MEKLICNIRNKSLLTVITYVSNSSNDSFRFPIQVFNKQTAAI